MPQSETGSPRHRATETLPIIAHLRSQSMRETARVPDRKSDKGQRPTDSALDKNPKKRSADKANSIVRSRLSPRDPTC